MACGAQRDPARKAHSPVGTDNSMLEEKGGVKESLAHTKKKVNISGRKAGRKNNGERKAGEGSKKYLEKEKGGRYSSRKQRDGCVSKALGKHWGNEG